MKRLPLGLRPCLLSLIVSVGVLFTPPLAAAEAQAESEGADAAFLRKNGIKPDAAGVALYLASLVPEGDSKEKIEQLIDELASDDFNRREDASRQLSQLPGARGALQSATESPDAEMSHRARRILDSAGREQESILLTALRLVRKEKYPGAAPHLLRMLPTCGKPYIRSAAVAALRAAAGAEDVPLLQTAIAEGSSDVRAAAIVALERAAGEAAVDTLRPYLKSEDELIRLAAVEALVNRQPRECLPVLVGLLEGDDAQVRSRSARMLDLLAGQSFTIAVNANDIDARQELASKWRQWVEGPGRSVELKVPLPELSIRLGRTLVCLFNHGGRLAGANAQVLAEIDRAGELTVLMGMAGQRVMPFGCQGLSNGHRLFTDWRDQSIVELDEQGKEIWRKRVAVSPANIERLENGHTLVAAYQQRQIIELNAAGETIWKADVGGMPSDVRALENGNLLVALSDRGCVIEMDRAGKEVWKIERLPGVWSARRMPDGNTLVSCYSQGRVVAIDPAGKTLWSIESLPNCFDAVLLDNGNVLVGYLQGLREVDVRFGKTVNEQPIGMVRRISVY